MFVHIKFALETLVSVILKKISIIFSYKYWYFNLCQCYFEENKFIVTPIYLHCCNIPEGYSSSSSKISDYINIVEITATQKYTRIV